MIKITNIRIVTPAMGSPDLKQISREQEKILKRKIDDFLKESGIVAYIYVE